MVGLVAMKDSNSLLQSNFFFVLHKAKDSYYKED